jgi:hypothetical protein
MKLNASEPTGALMQDDVSSTTVDQSSVGKRRNRLKDAGDSFLLFIFCLLVTVVLAILVKPAYYFLTWSWDSANTTRGTKQALSMGLVPLSTAAFVIVLTLGLGAILFSIAILFTSGQNLWLFLVYDDDNSETRSRV